MRKLPSLSILLVFFILVLSIPVYAEDTCTSTRISLEATPDGGNLIFKAYIISNYLSTDPASPPTSPSNAVVSFYKYVPKIPPELDKSDEVPITNCQNLPANKKVSTSTSIDSKELYYAECEFQGSEFADGKVKTIVAKLAAPSTLCAAPTPYAIYKKDSKTLAIFTEKLVSEITSEIPNNYPLCLGMFLMLGLLLSSMYFSGKSPLSLLDITTPRLPSPKAISAAGSNLGQMVYGRMKAITARVMATREKMFGIAAKESERRLMGRTPGIVAMVKKLAMGIKDPSHKSFLTIVALKMAERGESLDKIRKILKKDGLFGFTPEEHGELGQIINRLRETAKKKNNLIEQTIADDMDIFVTGFVKLNQMRILTGESGLGPRGRVLDTLYKLARLPVDGMKDVPGLNRIPIIKDIPGIGRLPFMGGFIGTSIDAFLRSARIQGRITRALAGEVIRTVGRVKEDKLADYKKIAEAAESGWLKRQLAETMIAGSPISVKIGYYVPIQRQMAELYKNLYTEAHQDVTRYLLKKIFERYGVKFDLTEMEVTEIGYKYFDIMERSGFKNNPNVAKLREVEAEIKKILSRAAASADPEEYYQLLYDKIREVKKVAARYSVNYDERGVDTALEQVRNIHEQKGAEAHVKLLSLYDYLIRVHKIDQPIGNDVEQKRAKGDFYFTMGRDSLTLRRGNQEVFSDLWEVYSLRNYIYNAENAYLRGNMEDVIKGNYIYLASRMLGLGSKFQGPDGKIDPEVKRITEQILGTSKDPRAGLLYSLLTDTGMQVAGTFENNPRKLLSGFDYMKTMLGGEGKELYVKFGDLGSSFFLDKSKDLVKDKLLKGEQLTDEEARQLKIDILGLPQTLGRHMVPIGFKDKRGKMQFYEENTEVAPLPEWWKIDMKRDWKGGNQPSGREVAIREYIDALLAKTKQFAHLPYGATVERELGGPLSVGNMENYKKLMAREILATEMYDFINGVMGMNTYKYTNETMRLYLKQAQGLLFGFFSQKSKDDKTGEYERVARELETMRIVAGEDNNRDIKRLSELLTKYNREFTEFLAAPVSYDTMKKSKSAWVQFHEGGLAPYVHGMPMSDFDRVMNGHVAIKDQNGKWRRFDPQRADAEAGLAKDSVGNELRMQFKALVNSQTKDKEGGTVYADASGAQIQASWKGLFNKMIEWAGNDFERQKTLGAALWRYAQVTNDWNSFWHDTKISVRPKNEVLEIGGILPFASHKEWSDTILEPMRKLTQASTAFGQWFERMSMYGGAPTYGASYDVVGSAEQFKQRLWSMNTRILSPEFESQFEAQAKENRMGEKDKKAFMDAFVEEANIYPKYHIVWIGGIDRNPWGSSTSYGIQSALGAGYHYGSASMWDFRWYRPMMEKKEWIPMSIFTLPVKPAIPLGLLFYRAFRGAQMAGWGYPGRWEYTGSSMQPYSYVNSSKMGMLRSFFNPFYSVFDMFRAGEVTNTERKFKWADPLRPWLAGLVGDQEMIRRDLGGFKYVRANAGAPQDIQWIAKGEYATFRYGAANPAAGHYTPRWELQLAARQAQYLIHGFEGVGRYFENVPEVSSRAYNVRVKREVGGQALAIKREEELRGFGMFWNSLWGWGSPFMFLYHLPFSPLSPRDVLQHYREGKRSGNWDTYTFTQKTRQIMIGNAYGGGFFRKLEASSAPWYYLDNGQKKYINPLIKDLVPCPRCGSTVHRFSKCMNKSCPGNMKQRGE